MRQLLEKLYYCCRNSALEETLARGLVLHLFPNIQGIIISSILFGLGHLVKFNWKMAVACAIGGIGLGFVYLPQLWPHIKLPWFPWLNLLLVIFIHGLVKFIGEIMCWDNWWRHSAESFDGEPLRTVEPLSRSQDKP